MATLEPKRLVTLLKVTLAKQGVNYERTIAEFGQVRASQDRLSGKAFGLEEHIRGLVLSLLSQQRPWKQIADNLERIRKIFYNYDPTLLKKANPDSITNSILGIHCGNRQIVNQMKTLRFNIEILEKIDRDWGSIDRFVVSKEPFDICTILSEPGGKYKLKQIGPALALEYLRNVGIRASKPDTNVRRAIGARRLAYLNRDMPDEEQTYRCMDRLADDAEVNPTYLDNLLWLLTAKDYGNICTETPRCAVCFLKEGCRGNV